MLKLIKNEWVKLWSKKSSWVMLVLTLAVIVAMLVGLKTFDKLVNGDEKPTSWKEQQQMTIEGNKTFLTEENLTTKEKERLENEIKIAEYRLKNNVEPPASDSTASFLESSVNALSLISLFGVIVAAGIVSFEFGTGTIKMLLTRPIARWKILLSKLITTFLFTILLTTVGFALSALLGYVFFDSAGTSLTIQDGKVTEVNLIGQTLYSYLLSYGDISMSIFFAFMLGTLFSSSSLAIGLTLFITFTSATLVALLQKYEFIKYFWFSVTDLNGIEKGYTILPDLTIGFALSVMAVYAIIFLVISFSVFTKKDITA